MAKPHGLIDRIGNENFDAGGLLVSPNMLDKVLKCFKRTAAQTIPRRGLHTMHGYFSIKGCITLHKLRYFALRKHTTYPIYQILKPC